jgi:hypothetical protein
MSKVPSRTRSPSAPALPASRSDRPKETLVVPYSSAISGRPKPPRASMWENISTMVRKSSAVAAKLPRVVKAKDVR